MNKREMMVALFGKKKFLLLPIGLQNLKKEKMGKNGEGKERQVENYSQCVFFRVAF